MNHEPNEPRRDLFRETSRQDFFLIAICIFPLVILIHSFSEKFLQLKMFSHFSMPDLGNNFYFNFYFLMKQT